MESNHEVVAIAAIPPSLRNIVIIGAGPTAIGALYRIEQLRANGLLNEAVCVHVLEQEAEAGGLARSVTDNDGFTWDLGVHVTGASKYAEFLDVLQSVVPEWNIVRRVVMVDMSHVMHDPNLTDNHDALNDNTINQPCSSNYSMKKRATNFSVATRNYVPYPVQNSIPYFPTKLKNDCLRDLQSFNGFTVEHKPIADENFGQFSEKIFGRTFQSIFIRPYNEKVWTVRLEEMNCKWLEGRVPRIDTLNIRRRCALSRSQLSIEDSAQPLFFRYPAGFRGIGEMWKRIISAKFSIDTFHFRRKVIRIDPIRKKVFAKVLKDSKTASEEADEEVYPYTMLISTVPLTELGRLTGLMPDMPLRFSKVILVGVGLYLPQGPLASKLSWAYYPRSEILFYRCTVLSNFSKALVPDANRYWSVLCEIGMRSEEPIHNEDILRQRTIKDLVTVGMIASESQVHSTWLKVLHHGYPVPTLNREETLKQVHELLEPHDIYSRGRFGGWRYEISNQDHSFECGLQLIDRVLLGIKESLYVN